MTIDSRTLYATLLGLKAPWEITDVEMKQPPGEVHIRVALSAGTLWVCPQCGSAAPIHDHMFAPIDTGMTVVLPNGLKHRIGLTRPYNRTDFDPPGTTGGTWQENVSINSNGTWQTTFALSAGTGSWQTTSPEGRSVTATVDESGRPLTVSVPGLSTITLGYDAAGRLENVTQGGRLWHYDYDDSGRVSRAISPKPDTVRFGYDAAGRLLRQDLPGGRVVGFGYDANGNVTALRPPGSELHEFDYSGVDQTTLYRAPGTGDRETQYSYNLDHQLETITQPGNVTVELDYDAGGRLWHVTQPRGTSALAYSPSTGQLASLTSADSLTTVAFGYNGSLPTSETWSGLVAGSVALDWSPQLQPRLQTVTAGGSTDTAGFAYDRDGLLRRAGALGVFPRSTNGLPDSTQASAVVSRQDQDGYGDLANLRFRSGASVLLQQSVQRDALGRIEQLDELAVDSSRTWEYGYDLAGRLDRVWRNGLLVQRTWYDANGNPDSVQGPGGAGDRITTEVDAQDRLLRYGDTGYTYTPNGELTMKVAGADTTRYTYDALGNLVTVVLPSGPRIDYLMDGRNRRVARKINGVMERQWLYQNGVSPVAELDGDGAPLWRFVYGTRAHVPDLAMRGDTVYRVVSDHLGSVRALVRASDGVVRAWWNYDAWGNVLTSSGPGPCLGFAGGLTDSLTGLVRFGARDYAPAVGRWTSKDPAWPYGVTNLFAYVDNDPVDATDPSGLVGEFWDPNPMIRAYIHTRDATLGRVAEMYGFAHEMRGAMHQRLPGNEHSNQRHRQMSSMMAREYGGAATRAFGVGNELQGFVLHDLPDLSARLSGRRPWAFDWMDLAANESGIAEAQRQRGRSRRCREVIPGWGFAIE